MLKQLSLPRGNDHVYTFTFKKEDGTPYCIKNWVVTFTIKTNPSLPDESATFQKTVTAFDDTTSGTSGSANIHLLSTDTENLDPGKYHYDFKVTTDSNQNFTIMKGMFDLEYTVKQKSGTAGTAT